MHAAKRTAKKHAKPNAKLSTSRMSSEAQMRIAAADVSTVLALEAADEATNVGKGKGKENVKLMIQLKKANEELAELQNKLQSTTPWPDLLGKKGCRV